MNIRNILKNKQIKLHKGKRPINELWETADEFGKYVGIPTPVVLRMFKLYGKGKVLGLRSWLYDTPYDPRKGGKIALANWKLKELQVVAKTNIGVV
jgi:hypothetical protein